MDADRLAGGQQVTGPQQLVDAFEHGRVLGGSFEHRSAADQRVDPPGSLALEVVAPRELEVEIGLQRCPQRIDLRAIEHIANDDEAVLVIAGEVGVEGTHGLEDSRSPPYQLVARNGNRYMRTGLSGRPSSPATSATTSGHRA